MHKKFSGPPRRTDPEDVTLEVSILRACRLSNSACIGHGLITTQRETRGAPGLSVEVPCKYPLLAATVNGDIDAIRSEIG